MPFAFAGIRLHHPLVDGENAGGAEGAAMGWDFASWTRATLDMAAAAGRAAAEAHIAEGETLTAREFDAFEALEGLLGEIESDPTEYASEVTLDWGNYAGTTFERYGDIPSTLVDELCAACTAAYVETVSRKAA